jgi:hypothetical protein
MRHVRERGDDVEVLRVGENVQEDQDQARVRPEAHVSEDHEHAAGSPDTISAIKLPAGSGQGCQVSASAVGRVAQ